MDDAVPSSAQGELSSLRSQLEEMSRRVTALAEEYGGTPDSQVASDLFAAERALGGALRSLDRAAGNLAS
ncbi:MAG TPA: hypothetical protein VM618_07865 [Acidimicrobiia bacterium]|nr:hypothetical protein [Acidimicrobiia bacterium]